MILAAYVAFEAIRILAAQDRPDASPIGIALTGVSLAVMLWLARAKRETGEALGSRELMADSYRTFACWYLSATTLAGLALNATMGLWWADPVAALVIAVFLVREAREAWEGRGGLRGSCERDAHRRDRRRRGHERLRPTWPARSPWTFLGRPPPVTVGSGRPRCSASTVDRANVAKD